MVRYLPFLALASLNSLAMAYHIPPPNIGSNDAISNSTRIVKRDAMDHCVAPGEHRCSVLVYTGVFGLAAPSGGGGTVSLTSGDTTIAVVDGGCNDITTSTHQDDGPGWKVQLHTVYGTLLEFWATYISLGDTGGINFRYDNNGPHSAWYYQSGDCQKRDWGFDPVTELWQCDFSC